MSAPPGTDTDSDNEDLIASSPVAPSRPSWSAGPPRQVGEPLDADAPAAWVWDPPGGSAVQLGPPLEADQAERWPHPGDVQGAATDLGPA